MKQNWQHDPHIRGTNGVHPNVDVWYSPEMWQWMIGGRKGDAPEGGMLVKEQYGKPKYPKELTDWAVMIRDNSGAWDGWWWGDLGVPNTVSQEPPSEPPPGEADCAPAEYPYAGFGQYCINCHVRRRVDKTLLRPRAMCSVFHRHRLPVIPRGRYSLPAVPFT